MKYFLSFLLLFIRFGAYARNEAASSPNQFTPPLCLIRNVGQIRDQHGNTCADIQYKSGDNGVSIFVGRGALHYQFRKIIKQFTNAASQPRSFKGIKDAPADSTQYEVYRLDVELAGASPDAQVMEEDGQPYYEQYYTAAAHAAAKCFNKITYKDIYPHIDWVLYIKDNKLEYDFIIKPGGNVKDIQIKYSGATDIAHQEGNIKVTTPMGDINEGKLYAYEQQSGEAVAASFTLKNNTLGFSVPASKQLKHSTLVIDPTLVWGTYYGSSNGTDAYAIARDTAENIYVTGSTNSTANIATTGAYQDTLLGVADIYLSKFNAGGTLLWGTYYGGGDEDCGYSVCCDHIGNVYITGNTSNTNNIATAGAYQTMYEGQAVSAYLAKFSPSGALLWATYYGDTTEGRAVTCDGENVYMTGATNGLSGIATEGAYKSTYDNNIGYIVKFDSAGHRQWGTYFGGCDVFGNSSAIAWDGAESIYLTGLTVIADSVATAGAYQTSLNDSGDAFLAKFRLDGSFVWGTYYGGEGQDYGTGVTIDHTGNVFMCGITSSSSHIAASGASQANYGGGAGDGFLVKFDSAGHRQWATYYGGTDFDGANGVTCNTWNNLFISGQTYSTNGISVADTYQDTLIGVRDAFLANFNEAGALIWATYYGGNGNTLGEGVSADDSGNVYAVGFTTADDDMATPGTYQSTFGGGEDAYIAKFGSFSTQVPLISSIIINMLLYPNPNNGKFTIHGQFHNFYPINVSIDIFNEKGESVYHSTEPVNNNTLNKTLSLSYLTPGMYTMHVSTGKESQAINFSVIR